MQVTATYLPVKFARIKLLLAFWCTVRLKQLSFHIAGLTTLRKYHGTKNSLENGHRSKIDVGSNHRTKTSL